VIQKFVILLNCLKIEDLIDSEFIDVIDSEFVDVIDVKTLTKTFEKALIYK
jgi:hypothetical protein